MSHTGASAQSQPAGSSVPHTLSPATGPLADALPSRAVQTRQAPPSASRSPHEPKDGWILEDRFTPKWSYTSALLQGWFPQKERPHCQGEKEREKKGVGRQRPGSKAEEQDNNICSAGLEQRPCESLASGEPVL